MIDTIAIGGILVSMLIHFVVLMGIGIYHKPKKDSANSGAKFG